MAKKLLGFDTKYNIEYGVDEIIQRSKSGLEDVPQMHTVDYYKKLLSYENELERFTNLKPKVVL